MDMTGLIMPNHFLVLDIGFPVLPTRTPAPFDGFAIAQNPASMPPGMLGTKILHDGVGVIRRARGKVGSKVYTADPGAGPSVRVGSAVPDPLTGGEGRQAVVSQDTRSDDEAPREGEAKQIVRPAETRQVPRDAHAVAVGSDLNRRVERPFMLYGTNGLPLKRTIGISADDAASVNARKPPFGMCLLDGEPIDEEGGAILTRQNGTRRPGRAARGAKLQGSRGGTIEGGRWPAGGDERERRGSGTRGTGRGLSLKNETSGTCY